MFPLSESLSTPSASLEAHHLTWLAKSLPVIAQPRHDIDLGHALNSVFFEFREGQCHLKLVYDGEGTYDRRYPSRLNVVGSFLYRSFNFLSFKRTADINQLCFNDVDFEGPRPYASISTEDYCGERQTWANGTKKELCWYFSLMHHHDLEASYEKWEREDHRPVIYLNTNNHLMGPKNHNPELEYVYWRSYKCFVGGEDEAERYGREVVEHKCNLLSCFQHSFCCCMDSLKRRETGGFAEVHVWL